MIRIILPFAWKNLSLTQRYFTQFNKPRKTLNVEKYRLDYQYFKNIKSEEKADEYDRIAETRQSDK